MRLGGAPGRDARYVAAQIDALVGAATEPTPSYAALIATTGYTGARIREVLALRWRDIDHGRNLIHFRGPLDVAGDSVVEMKTTESIRAAKLTPRLEALLGREVRMRSRWSGDDDFVFSARRGRPKDYANVRRALAVASKHAGIERVRPHDLRHSFSPT